MKHIPRLSPLHWINRDYQIDAERTTVTMTSSLTRPDTLRVVLHFILNAPDAVLGLSPHVVLMGRPVSTGARPPVTPPQNSSALD